MSTHSLLEEALLEQNDLDGILALSHILRQEASIEIFPRQIVVLKNDKGESLDFVHGIPGDMVLTSAVTAQNKQMRRAIFERHKIPVPKATNFSVGRGMYQSRKAAERIGFPVVVKPTKGDIGFYSFLNIKNRRQFRNATAKMKVPVHLRQGIFRAGYSPIELAMPGAEGGKPTVAPAYRFMVEKQESGHLLRFLVNNGKVIAAIKCEGSPSDGSLIGYEDVLRRIHPLLIVDLKRISQAISHLPVATIDIVAKNYAIGLKRPRYKVVDFSERPALWVYALTSIDEAERLSKVITHNYLKSQAFSTKKPVNQLSAPVMLFSLPSARLSAEALPSIASQYSVHLTVETIDDLGGAIKANVSGGYRELAIFFNSLTNGKHPEVPAGLLEVF